MGKIDDMRRLREQQFAETEQRRVMAAKVATVATPDPAPPPARRKAAEEPKAAAATDVDSGKCPECGKVKPVKNGVMASHQKGFGKACPGTRKAPL